MIILFFFAAGKVIVFPLQAGANAMNIYGCRAQGLVSSRHKISGFIQWLEESHIGFADTLTEEFANKYGELRWAVTPSVFQHIGRKSVFDTTSKHAMSASQKLRSFAFELYEAVKLHEEHESIYVAHILSCP